MYNQTSLWSALKTLVERESYWQGKRADKLCQRKIAIFTAGPTAQSFYKTLKDEWGIEADFFIDNNPQLENEILFDKKILKNPWVDIENFSDEYSVIIATAYEYYEQISEQLENVGISGYMNYASFIISRYWDRYEKILDMLADDLSKTSYLASIYCLLTGDDSFIQFDVEQYFGVKDFLRCGDEIIVDLGAYVGDTVEEYYRKNLIGLKIYAFEPGEQARAALTARVNRLKTEWNLKADDIEIIPAGAGEKTETISFISAGSSMLRAGDSGNEKDTEEMQIYSLDDFFKDKEKFTLLKSDIEGMELPMLSGAKNTISEYKPKMTLSIYHSPQEFFLIPEYVHKLNPDYKMWVRNHYSNFKDTVLYCY